jgi:hypothetical protein
MNPRQSEHWKRRARHRVVALMILFLLLALLFFYPHASSNAFGPTPQARRSQPQGGRRRPPAPQPQTGRTGGGRTNYARFRHESHRPPAAKLDCNDCHAIRSAAAPDRITAATNASADGYPYHDSCVQCHRQQFFVGAAPSICTVCHTRSSPRLTARDMRPFPRQTDQAIAREFPGYFPHSLHQGVLARRDDGERNWTFVRASFRAPDTAQQLDNCASCHLTDERAPEPIKVGGTEATYKPEAGTFKTVPAGHAACFNCHWQAQKPLKDDCAGCHLSQAEYAKRKRAASIEAPLPGVMSANAAQWFKTWPQDWPKRLSIKFRHQTTNHDVGCTTCHINITQMETLNIPKADVPIATCAPCHISASPVLRREGGANVTIFSEMADEAKDADNKSNTCVGCHTSLIGSERPPCSHYLILGQPCPQ